MLAQGRFCSVLRKYDTHSSIERSCYLAFSQHDCLVFYFRDFLKAFIPVLFATGAFFMGLLGNFYCETIAFTAESGTDLPALLFGVFYYKGYEVVQLPPNSRTVIREVCFQYPEGTDFDAKWKTAKSFAIITPISTYKSVFCMPLA